MAVIIDNLPGGEFGRGTYPLQLPPAGAHTPPRCPATYRYQRPYDLHSTGVQCKYGAGHDGSHCGHPGFTAGDVFWDDEPEPDTTLCSRQREPNDLVTDPCPSCGHAILLHVNTEECPACVALYIRASLLRAVDSSR